MGLDDIECRRARAALDHRLFGDPPPSVGRYALGETLGAGASGVVYAAHDPVLRRRVAIKVWWAGPDARRGTLVEARALARLRHPHVVAVHDVATDATTGAMYAVMDLVEGTTLERYLAGAPPVASTLRLLRQAGQGLATAHEAGVVHRDFKPSNVMVDEHGQALVVDFGLSSSSPQPGAPVGTPGFIAPEVEAGAAADARSDQFAFCVVAQAALARSRGHVARRVGRALRRGAHPDPRDRFPDMRRLLAALSPAAAGRRWLAVPAVAVAMLFTQGRADPPVDCDAGLGAIADLDVPPDDPGTRWAVARLGDRAQAWADACRGARPELAPCLARSRAELGEAAGLLGDGDLPGRVAVDVVAGLRPLQSCEPGRTRPGPGAIHEFDALDRSRLLEDAMRPAEALAVAEAVRDAARARDDALLEAEALHRIAGVQEHAHAELELAERILLDALWLAESARSDRVVAEVSTTLARVLGARRARPEAAERYATVAAAAIARLGEPAWLAGRLERVRGAVAYRRGEFERCATHQRRAIDLLEPMLGRDHPSVVSAYNRLGNARFQRGEYVRSAEIHEHVLAAYVDARGPDDPSVAGALSNIAAALVGLGQVDLGLEAYERALAIIDVRLPVDHPKRALVLGNYATALLRQERFVDADAAARRAIDVLQPAGAHPDLAGMWTNLGLIRSRAGWSGEAEHAYRRSLQLWAETEVPDHPHVAFAQLGAGLLALEAGRGDEAVTLLEVAVQRLARDDDSEPEGLANARFALARSIAAADPARARALAEQAHAVLRTLPGSVDNTRDVEAWLAQF